MFQFIKDVHQTITLYSPLQFLPLFQFSVLQVFLQNTRSYRGLKISIKLSFFYGYFLQIPYFHISIGHWNRFLTCTFPRVDLFILQAGSSTKRSMLWPKEWRLCSSFPTNSKANKSPELIRLAGVLIVGNLSGWHLNEGGQSGDNCSFHWLEKLCLITVLLG